MRKIDLLLTAAAVITAIVMVAASSASTQEQNLRSIMQLKLDHAHTVLEALITEDFGSLKDSATALGELSNEASWFVLQTPEYTRYSSAFRLAASEIAVSADERNVERAALGYVEMTLKCVQCHQHLRGVGRASEPMSDPALPSLDSIQWAGRR